MLKVMQVALIWCCQQASSVHTFAFPPQKYPSFPAFISPSGKSVSVPAVGEPAKKQQKKKKTWGKTLQYHKSSRLWLHASHCPEHSVTRLKIHWKCLSLNTGAIFIYQCDRSESERELAGHFACGDFSPISVQQGQPCYGLVCVDLLGLFTVMCSGLPTGQKKLNQHWNQYGRIWALVYPYFDHS